MTQALTSPLHSDGSEIANEHLRPDEISKLLRPELDRLSEAAGGAVCVDQFGRLKPVADSTTKFLVRDQLSRPFAVIICSRPISRHLMQRGSDRAEEARAVGGERLGRAIIKPISTGYVDGRSYVVLPWFRDVPTSRLRWPLERRRLRRPVFRWLAEATHAAATFYGTGPESVVDFASVLEHMGRQSFINGQMRESLDRAQSRLASGSWQPHHVVDHNDLYRCNILLRPRRSKSNEEYPFVIIDWAGANPKGYGMYDLVRAARSFKLASAGLACELAKHAQALRCELRDLEGHLLASFGWLHRNIEHFPEDRYIAAIHGCWRAFKEAMQCIEQTTAHKKGTTRTPATAIRRSMTRPVQRLLERPAINRLYTRLRTRWGAFVLMYHSVASPEAAQWIDPENHVSAEMFAQQMQFLSRHRHVVPLSHIIESIKAGEDPDPGTVAITFDDGYLDNLTVAAPILDSLGLKATIFLPTRYIDDGRNQWIDEAYCAFKFRTKHLLPWGGDAGLTFQLDDDEQRSAAYRMVCESLMSASFERRSSLLAQLRESLAPSESPPRLTMNWDDVRTLVSQHSSFELGGHTVNHANMLQCSAAEARHELTECRRRIQEQTGSAPRHFSFPYGRFSPELRAMVMEAGFESACGSLDDPLINRHVNQFAIRRVKAPQSLQRLVFLSSSANTGLLHRLGR